MRDAGYILKFIIVAAVQVVLWNYFNFSQYIIVAILPVMIIALPTRHGTPATMAIAFVTGFLADFTASGMLGLSCLALLPVAYLRLSIVRFIFGEELLARGENVSIRRQGYGKMIFATAISTAMFLALYIWADGAGTRPFWFNLMKFALSLTISTVISVFVALIMDPDNS